MNDYEKYLFDLNGFIVLEDVLKPDEVAACNQAIDHYPQGIEYHWEDQSLAGGSAALKADHGRADYVGMLAWPQPWCRPFRDLLAHPRIMPYLEELLRDGFRLDHHYGISMKKGTEGFVLHGGGAVDQLIFFYQFHSGRMRCGLTVVSWVLTDCGPEDGGFVCIPGSHKANYPLPPEAARLEKDPGLKHIAAKAGSAIIFTEALTHGTLPWRASHERRMMLYKYTPGQMAHQHAYPPPGVAEVLHEFTPEQRALLERPYNKDRLKRIADPVPHADAG